MLPAPTAKGSPVFSATVGLAASPEAGQQDVCELATSSILHPNPLLVSALHLLCPVFCQYH